MEKNIRITLAGTSFTIDEPAFDRLRKYLDDLDFHFRGRAEAGDILQDIELRIAELFTQRLAGRREVVSIADVNLVIEQLGTAQDMDGDGPDLGQGSEARRVYRDGDNAVLGGVCSGLGSYLGFDPVWVRVLFVVLLFGFGTGVLLYIILWIIIPEAKTTAEKLEMRGRPVDLRNIESTLKDNFKRMENYYHREGKHRAGRAAKRAGEMAGSVALGTAQVMGRVAAAFILIISLILLIGLLVGVGIMDAFGWSHALRGLFESASESNWAVIAVVALIAVPLLGMITFGLTHVFGLPRKPSGWRYTLGGLSTLAFLSVLYLGFMVALDFQESATVATNKPTTYFRTDTLYLSFNVHPDFRHHFRSAPWHRRDFFEEYPSNRKTGNVSVQIGLSLDSQVHISTLAQARGETKALAGKRASRIRQEFLQKDSMFIFSNVAEFPNSDPWRRQGLTYQIWVPAGYVIMSDEIPENILVYSKTQDGQESIDPSCRIWIMGENGLKCKQVLP